MYVDGNEDLTKEAAAVLDGFAADDEVVVCTDLFGGSVNNEFTKICLLYTSPSPRDA